MKDFLYMIEKQSWQSIRHLVRAASPALADVIDDIDPSDDDVLYRVKYPYGALIADKGIFQLPNSEGRLVSVYHASLSSEIKNDLIYTGTIPLGLVISNGVETFIQSKQRMIPGRFKQVGELVSLARVLEAEASSYHLGWTVTSGARSICMLPKVTDSQCHKALKVKYGLKSPVPQTLLDQWEIFVHLANHVGQQPWSSELIFFSKKWFEHDDDKRWGDFNRFLLNKFREESIFTRNQVLFDSVFSMVQENKNLKPNPYLADNLKHLIAIGSGATPALTPAIDDSVAPVSQLQKIYLEDYGLKKYAPVIMHAHHFSLTEKRPVYYSLQMPTSAVFSPKSRKLTSTMVELQELKHIMEVLFSEILKGNMGLEKTPLYAIANHISYDYYHSDKDKLNEILPVTEIAKLDHAFTQSIIDDERYVFPEFAPFLRGCIGIAGDLNEN